MADDPWNSNNDAWGSAAGDGWGGSPDINANKTSSTGCRNCGEEGHFARVCPRNGGKGCFKCGSDHMAKDCEKPDVCKRCGEEGHFVRDCTEEMKTRVIEKGDGTTTEIYVPQETKLEELFDNVISSGINFDKYDDIQTTCKGDDLPPLMQTFEDMNLRLMLLDNVKKAGYKKPTPIQKISVPCILNGRDLMACAQTGSGKTAAFLLPILHKILADGCDAPAMESPQKPYAVIVAPTRELAIQIKDEARKFSSGSVVRVSILYGGTSTGYQLQQLFKGTHVLVATPGRLLDIVNKEKVSFENVKFVVLDEADRMLDMGFMPDVQDIMGHSTMPKKGEGRQTLLFSATFPEEIQQLAFEFLDNYVFSAVGIVGGACSDVKQTFLEVEKFKKRETLQELLADVATDRTLVFVETKKGADFLASFLSGIGLPTTSIHGDRLQRERETALKDFKTGRMPVLVATAVAARGLDIKDVRHVVNYDMPKSIDEYVHRIGRTGRVGNLGKATSFYDSANDSNLAADLVKILSDSQQEVPDFLQGAVGMGVASGQAAFGGVDIRDGANEGW